MKNCAMCDRETVKIGERYKSRVLCLDCSGEFTFHPADGRLLTVDEVERRLSEDDWDYQEAA